MCFHSVPIVTFSAGTLNFKRHFSCLNLCDGVQQLLSCPSLCARMRIPADVTIKN